MSKISNVWFKMEIDSGNAAVVDDPTGTILACFEQVRGRFPLLMGGDRIKLRDVNGNFIGRAWLAVDEDEERADDCN
jgi:hypothetical protein